MKFPFQKFKEAALAAGHSMRYIEAIRLYAEKLEQNGMPVIFDTKHLALLLNIEENELSSFVNCPEAHYHYYLIKKRNGNYRRIVVPSDRLKKIQSWINNHILSKYEQPTYVTGFVRGRSIVTNAKIHENKKYLLNIDIKDFFESVSIKQVEEIFFKMGYEKQLSLVLAKLCTTKIEPMRLQDASDLLRTEFHPLLERSLAFLVQGSPTSPTLANMAAAIIDARLKNIADASHSNYSRYADDITFSADDWECLPKLGKIKVALESTDFVLNEEKIKYGKMGCRQMITGLLVDGHVRVPKIYKKAIFRHLHLCCKYGGWAYLNRISNGRRFGKEWLLGRISFVHSVEPEVAAKMLNQFNQINWIPQS